MYVCMYIVSWHLVRPHGIVASWAPARPGDHDVCPETRELGFGPGLFSGGGSFCQVGFPKFLGQEKYHLVI